MAESITIKALQDASLDAKSLEEVVNGNESKQVTTRLGETYPSVKKAIKTMFENGGLPATPFATKALMTASALVDGKYAMVTDDTVNNGVYVKTAGAWVKSEYDPLSDAISFAQSADEQVLDDAKNYTNSFIYNDGNNKGLFYTDKNGSVIFYVLDDGSVHAHGLEKPLQEYVLGDYTQDDTKLLEFLSSNKVPFIRVDDNAEVRITGLKNTVQNEFKELRAYNNLSLSAVKIPDLQARETIINVAQDVVDDIAVSKHHLVQSKFWDDMSYGNARMPSLIGLDDNKILLIWGEGGDQNQVSLYKRIVSYSDEGDIIEFGERELLVAPTLLRGVTKHPMLCKDKHGNIVFMFDQRESENIFATNYQMVCKSYDNGVTFTTPIQLPQPSWSANRGVANGSTGNMVLLDSGRIVCPAWSLSTGSQGILTIYSDDDGETWTYTEAMDAPYHRESIALQEPAIAKLDNGDLLFSCRIEEKSEEVQYINRKYMCISRDNGETVEDVGFNYDLVSCPCASSMVYDDERGLLLHASPTQLEYAREGYLSQISGRQRPRVQISADRGETFKVASKFIDVRDTDMYGYSTITKLKTDLYAVIYEGVSSVAITNSQESTGLVIFNLKGVFANVVNS